MDKPVRWYGPSDTVWHSSPDRGFSVAAWELKDGAAGSLRAVVPSDSHLICAHLSGSMNWEIEGNGRSHRNPALSNTFCVGLAGESASIAFSNAEIRFLHFYIPLKWFETEATDLNSDGFQVATELIDPMNSHEPCVAGIARRAARALFDGSVPARLELEASVLDLCATLVRDHSTKDLPKIRKGGLSPKSVKRAIDALEANLVEGISVAELARLTGLSHSHFCREFKVQTGVSPHRYLIDLRLARARSLLRRPSMTVAEAASSVGYDDPAYFSRLFRRELGMTPSDWARSSGENC